SAHEAMGRRVAVRAADQAAGALANAVARGVAGRRLFGLDHEIERDAEPAAMLAVAAGIGEVLVVAEMQGKARLRDLDAAEFQAADGVPLADRRPAVAAGRGAAAGPRVKHVPDEAAP